jgi:hypothetical protein
MNQFFLELRIKAYGKDAQKGSSGGSGGGETIIDAEVIPHSLPAEVRGVVMAPMTIVNKIVRPPRPTGSTPRENMHGLGYTGAA